MDREQIASIIRVFVAEHGTDHVSRDRLVWDVLKFMQPLGPGDLTSVREYLFDLVATEGKEWKLAIEILVQEGAPGTALRLKQVLETRAGSGPWRHFLILGLLQIGEQSGRDTYIAYVRAGLAQNRDGVRTLLAALCRVDPQASVNMAAGFFARALSFDKGVAEVRGSVPAFVKYYLKKDENLLPELVRQACLINLRAGKRLQRMIADDLSNPAIVSEFEQDKVERILIELSA